MTSYAFLAAALTIALTPGPALTYVVLRTVAGGRAEGLASCLGTGLGGLVHLLGASLGLSVLLAQSPLVFEFFKYLGAAYLVYTGLALLRRQGLSSSAPAVVAQGTRRALIDGIVVEALNVKTALFFLAFLPQFTVPDAPMIAQLVFLGGVFLAICSLVEVTVVLVAHRLLETSRTRQARAQWLTCVSGFTLMGLGSFLVLESGIS